MENFSLDEVVGTNWGISGNSMEKEVKRGGLIKRSSVVERRKTNRQRYIKCISTA